MKRVYLFFMLITLSVSIFAADRVVKLPKPNLNRAGTVMKALSERHSSREFSSKKLSLSDLSDLLWAANGINRPATGKRTAPSARNKQDIDLYVILSDASYIYDAKKHQLNIVAQGDYRSVVAGVQDYVKKAPVVLVLVSDISRFGDSKQVQSHLVGAIGAMDAGIVSQNISVFCASAKLATVPRASMNAEGLKKVLKLNGTQIPMMNHPIGYFNN